MRILFHSWNEVTRNDMVETLRRVGHEVYVLDYPVQNYLVDGALVARAEDEIKKQKIECIVGADYLPILSKISFRNQIPYLAWVYDAPCLAMYSDMIFSPYNYIFHFDRTEVERFRAAGVKQIYHMPLAVNVQKMQDMMEKNPHTFERDVAFLGTLYTGETNFLDQIQGLSEYQKAFLQAVMDVQLKFFGMDLLEEILPKDFMEGLLQKVSFQTEQELFLTEEQLMYQMIRKKMTVVERREILKLLSEHFDTHLYTQSDTSELPRIKPHSYINYDTQMPDMFYQSKVNINITLRSIQSGISLRCMDILGAGGFLLSNYQPELAEYFEDGKEVVMYHSRADLVEKVQYYLKHDAERMQIAANGQKKVFEQFSYEKAWEQMFQRINENMHGGM